MRTENWEWLTPCTSRDEKETSLTGWGKAVSFGLTSLIRGQLYRRHLHSGVDIGYCGYSPDAATTCCNCSTRANGAFWAGIN